MIGLSVSCGLGRWAGPALRGVNLDDIVITLTRSSLSERSLQQPFPMPALSVARTLAARHGSREQSSALSGANEMISESNFLVAFRPRCEPR